MVHDMDQGHESHIVSDSLSQNDTVGGFDWWETCLDAP